MDFTKSEKKQLRLLAADAYEAEARQMLEKLESEFRRWREGEIRSAQLIAAIHDFHEHGSRDLWSVHNGRFHYSLIVSRAIGLGLMPESKVPPTLLARLHPNSWRERSRSEDDDS